MSNICSQEGGEGKPDKGIACQDSGTSPWARRHPHGFEVARHKGSKYSWQLGQLYMTRDIT